MGDKAKKYILVGVLLVALALIAVWAFSNTAGSEDYAYQGYIIAMRQSGKDTIITTILGDKKTEFTIKKSTKEIFNGDLKEMKVGAFIRLDTARGSETNVKRFTAYEAFSMEGKIIFMENQESPFLLTIDKTLNYYMLYSLISSQDIPYSLQTGTQVRVYYQYPLNISTTTVVVDVIETTTDVLSEPTEKEISYIGRQGYKVAGK